MANNSTIEYDRETIIQNIDNLHEISPTLAGSFAWFVGELCKFDQGVIAGAVQLYKTNPQLYWLLGDLLAGGAGAAGSGEFVTLENAVEILEIVRRSEGGDCPAEPTLPGPQDA